MKVETLGNGKSPFDRPEKEALCAFFRTIIKGNKLRFGQGEIEESLFASKLPANTTPSLIYFWPMIVAREERGEILNRGTGTVVP